MRNGKLVKDNDIEKIINIVKSSLADEGYEIKRYSDGKKYSTTAYDCLMIKKNGQYFEIAVDEVKDLTNPFSGETLRVKDKFTEMDIK